jgi:hypothetical protein
MSARANIEAALSATADRLSPGSGASAVSHFKNDIAMIDGSSDDVIRRYARQEVRIAAPAVFESKRPDGDPVTIEKPREGVIVVFPDGLVFVRGIAFGARESKALKAGDFSVERVTTVLDGTEIPGLRITARMGKPKFAVAITQAQVLGSPTEQAAVRDEIVALLAR